MSIQLDQLPLAPLKRWLQRNLDAEGDRFLTPGSVGLDSLAAEAKAPFVTALPNPARDGQEVNYLADATNGIVWNLKYRAAEAGTFKWYCIGGNPLSAFVGAQDTIVANALAVAPTNPGPSLVLPRAGDYYVWVAQQSKIVLGATAGAWTDLNTAVVRDATTNIGSAMYSYLLTAGIQREGMEAKGPGLLVNQPAGSTYALYYSRAVGVGTNTVQVSNRRLTFMPVRIS